ncbi:MAG: hypothetical protein K0S61_4390 [Anaerocolumna sp.]|jgi:hypothetical protein|nr:hypothetical protein [Anaerocolumna sp.]
MVPPAMDDSNSAVYHIIIIVYRTIRDVDPECLESKRLYVQTSEVIKHKELDKLLERNTL